MQICIDIALSLCATHKLGTPATYAEAFQKLGEEGVINKELSNRLSQATGFRNRIVHAYEKLDMGMIYKAAKSGPTDLRLFLSAVSKNLC